MITDFTIPSDLIPRLCHLADAEGNIHCQAELSVDTYPTGIRSHYVEDVWISSQPQYHLSDAEIDILKAEAWDAAASEDDAAAQMAAEARAEVLAEDRAWFRMRR